METTEKIETERDDCYEEPDTPDAWYYLTSTRRWLSLLAPLLLILVFGLLKDAFWPLQIYTNIRDECGMMVSTDSRDPTAAELLRVQLVGWVWFGIISGSWFLALNLGQHASRFFHQRPVWGVFNESGEVELWKAELPLLKDPETGEWLVNLQEFDYRVDHSKREFMTVVLGVHPSELEGLPLCVMDRKVTPQAADARVRLLRLQFREAPDLPDTQLQRRFQLSLWEKIAYCIPVIGQVYLLWCLWERRKAPTTYLGKLEWVLVPYNLPTIETTAE